MLLNQSRLYDEQGLVDKCLRMIDKHTKETLMSDTFTDIDLPTVKAIVERDTLCVQEITVYQAVEKWAEVECLRKKMDTTADNKRQAIGEVLHMIRMPLMKIEEFAEGPAKSKLLTPEETTDVFLYFTTHEKPSLNFPTTPRSTNQEYQCLRFLDINYGWTNGPYPDKVEFTASKGISLIGVGVYGSCMGGAVCTVEAWIEHQGDTLQKYCGKQSFDGGSHVHYIYYIYFSEPVDIEEGEVYTINVKLENNMVCYYGTGGLASIDTAGVTFNFDSCTVGNHNGTSDTTGQIPAIVFHT